MIFKNELPSGNKKSIVQKRLSFVSLICLSKWLKITLPRTSREIVSSDIVTSNKGRLSKSVNQDRFYSLSLNLTQSSETLIF